MRGPRRSALLGGLALLVVAASAASAAANRSGIPIAATEVGGSTVEGVVQSLDDAHIVVDGVAHPLQTDTRFERVGSGTSIDRRKVVPGTAVILELDSLGRAVGVRVVQPG